MATVRTRPSKGSVSKLSGHGGGSSRLNLLIVNRCAIPVHELAKAIMISPLNLKRYCNSPLVYFTVNQLMLLSFYLNLSFRVLLEVVSSEEIVVDIPPSFFAAVQKRNLKINGECVGNMLPPPKDASEKNWFDE